MIVFKLDEQGGFIAGDDQTKVTAYAYSTSDYAVRAKQRPVDVSVTMINAETRYRERYALETDAEAYDEENWKRLADLVPA